MELYILIVAVTALIWLGAKGYFALSRINHVWTTTSGILAPIGAVITDRLVWTYLLLFGIDFVITSFLAIACRLAIPGRMGGAVSATVSLILSVAIFLRWRQ